MKLLFTLVHDVAPISIEVSLTDHSIPPPRLAVTEPNNWKFLLPLTFPVNLENTDTTGAAAPTVKIYTEASATREAPSEILTVTIEACLVSSVICKFPSARISRVQLPEEESLRIFKPHEEVILGDTSLHDHSNRAVSLRAMALLGSTSSS